MSGPQQVHGCEQQVLIGPIIARLEAVLSQSSHLHSITTIRRIRGDGQQLATIVREKHPQCSVYETAQLKLPLLQIAVDHGGIDEGRGLVQLHPWTESSRGRWSRPHEVHATDVVLLVVRIIGQDVHGKAFRMLLAGGSHTAIDGFTLLRSG